MLVQILKNDQPGYEKICATFDVTVTFFSVNENLDMVNMLLPDDISKATLFYLTRAAEAQNEFYRLMAKI